MTGFAKSPPSRPASECLPIPISETPNPGLKLTHRLRLYVRQTLCGIYHAKWTEHHSLVWEGDPRPKTCPIINFLLNNLSHLQIRPLKFHHHMLGKFSRKYPFHYYSRE